MPVIGFCVEYVGVGQIWLMHIISPVENDFDVLWKHISEDHKEDGALEKFVEAAPSVWVYDWVWEELKGEKPTAEWLRLNTYSTTL